MNARLYDPAVGRFLSPDPYVQAPGNSQNFNRYSYCLNNPLKYNDPSGENWLLLYLLYCTEPGYQLQKYFSPVAYKIELDLIGSHQIGIGIKMGVGMPKLASVFSDKDADWYEASAKYYWKDYGGYKGWEFTYGKETTTTRGMYTEGYTNVIKRNGDKDYSQSIGYKKLGIPGIIALEHYNDAWGNEVSDKFNTATSKIIFGPVSLENVIFTGEPIKDQNGNYEKIEKTDIFGNKYSVYKEAENSPRHGVLALRIGPLRIGTDSEEIRATIQNGLHMFLGDTQYQYRPYKPRWFFQFGW